MKTDVMKLVTFKLRDDLFAADIASVERVLRYTAPSAVPDLPSWIEGVIEHQGTVIPVVSLRGRMGLAPRDADAETRILVFTTESGHVGAVVDTVLEVAMVPAANVSPPPALFRGLAAEFVRGIAKVRDQIVVVLDVDRLVSSADRIVLDEAAAQTVSAEARVLASRG